MLSLSLLPHNPSKKFLLQDTLSGSRIQCKSSSNKSPYIGYSVTVDLTGLPIGYMQCNSSSNKSLYMIQCNSVSNRQLQDSVILALRGVGAKLEVVMFRPIQVLFPYMYGLLSHMYTGRPYAQQQLISCQLHLLGLVTLVDLLFVRQQLASLYTDVILQLMLTHIQPW